MADDFSDDNNATSTPALSDEEDVKETIEGGNTDDELAELENEDDLFGDVDEEEEEEEEDVEDDESQAEKSKRLLDDEELDSGDDEGQDDRRLSPQGPAEVEYNSFNFIDAEFPRHAVPEPSDNELYLLKIPRFLSIDPNSYNHFTFQPPTTDHHSRGPPSSTFSASKTAQTTIRWRHSPSKPSQLQSNARILRWSDGSITLQLASDPMVQYEIDAKALAPPQHNPIKPTPTNPKGRRGRSQASPNQYDASQDSFTYLAAPYTDVGIFRITNKITAGLTVLPSAASTDDALERLTMSLAEAVRKRDNPLAELHSTILTEDPELAKKRAEAAEREKLKQQRMMERANTRNLEKHNRALGRAGLRTGTGLTVGSLEDEEGGMRRSAHRSKARKPRRGEIYSDDEEHYGRRGRTREDEYDEQDEFIAPSEEEPEIIDDDDEEEELFDDDMDAEGEPDEDVPARHASPEKRTRDAEADDIPSASGIARKRRRVVEDDDDDEE